MTLLLSVAAMVVCLVAAYYSRENWYSSVYLLALRHGEDEAAMLIGRACGYNKARADRTVARAVTKYQSSHVGSLR